jgi:hypothetical protein
MVFARGITEMSNSREAFEMWAAFELMEHDFEMGEHGEYLDDFLQQSWLGWNAARAQDGGEVEPFGAESAYQTAKKSILTGSNMIISCDLVRELVEALRNSESQQPSTVVQESAACVSPAPHYETQRGLSCKNDTQSTVVPSGVWQFYFDGEWTTGMNTNDHRANTKAAGFLIRDLWLKQEPTQ